MRKTGTKAFSNSLVANNLRVFRRVSIQEVEATEELCREYGLRKKRSGQRFWVLKIWRAGGVFETTLNYREFLHVRAMIKKKGLVVS